MASAPQGGKSEKPNKEQNKDGGRGPLRDGQHTARDGGAERARAGAGVRRGGPCAQDARGRTSLFDVAERGDLDGVRRIIFGLPGTGLWPQRLALIEALDASGLTAADVAEQAGHQEIASLLRGEQARMEYYG